MWTRTNRGVFLTLLVLMAGLLALSAALRAEDAARPAMMPPAAGGSLPAGREVAASDGLGRGFENPPASARPWVFWFWINGNISKEGITADLESFRRVGVGGVTWMEVSGRPWAPQGAVKPGTREWQEDLEWAVRECERLGLQFDLSVDFGYGSGGPHITPELSMQQLLWSEKPVQGGERVSIVLEKPRVAKSDNPLVALAAKNSPRVAEELRNSDSYRDIAILAIPLPASEAEAAKRIDDLNFKSGLDWKRGAESKMLFSSSSTEPAGATPAAAVIDLSGRMQPDGRLTWDAPPGKWLILRFGHACNLKMTRPCPAAATGLECDRLAKVGIDTHYQAFLKPLIEEAESRAGRTLVSVHIDSWEAGLQNWTAGFPSEFRQRRGYDLRPWLPVFTGRVIGSVDLSERFLWDLRATIGELIRDNYAGRLRQLAQEHGMGLSLEAYGHVDTDNLSFAGISDTPMSEFWAMGTGKFPVPGGATAGGGYELSSKAMASAAHAYGKAVVGAEAFTGDRGWGDHPFLLKAMGDKAFVRGVNRLVFHASVHQPYENMVPGMTHQRWGEHFDRFNTWWEYGRPWTDYLTRCQYLLQQGTFMADVCCLAGEGVPLNVDDMRADVPQGYDYDLCSAENVMQMKVRDGRLVLPSGMSYGYLVLSNSDRMTLPLARKVRDLVVAGARVVGGQRPQSPPSLSGYPQCDSELAKICAELWGSGRLGSGQTLAQVFQRDHLPPDFEGDGLLYHHRRVGEAEVYFVSQQENRPRDVVCTFRVAGKRPQLWNAETGEMRELPDFVEKDGRISVPLHFEPMQSWFVVFQPGVGAGANRGANFASCRLLRELAGGWQVSFDPKWGGPDKAVEFASLTDWSQHSDARIRYYSGTAIYRKSFTLSEAEASGKTGRLFLDLGVVNVIARVSVNGKVCGTAWKPPYLLDIARAARAGSNELEIEVVNLWVNRMIGDEQLPEDSEWLNSATLAKWPDWFKAGAPRPSGRYTFTSWKHYGKDSPLAASGLLGPVELKVWLPEGDSSARIRSVSLDPQASFR